MKAMRPVTPERLARSIDSRPTSRSRDPFSPTGGLAADSQHRSAQSVQLKLQAIADRRPAIDSILTLQDTMDNRPVVQAMSVRAGGQTSNPAKARHQSSGLPDRLQSGIEQLSGLSMDGVNVHYNSGKPAQLQAHAYTQGNQIHLGPGQEKHLAHEAWHVVQQRQGRVQPTVQMNGAPINDNHNLEREADQMGLKALRLGSSPSENQQMPASPATGVSRLSASGLVTQLMKIPNYPTEGFMIARVRGIEGLTQLSTGVPEQVYEEIDLLTKQADEKGWGEALHQLQMLKLKLEPLEELPDWVTTVGEGALRDFFKINKRQPREALIPSSPSKGFGLLQLTNFHRVIQQILGDVNEEKGTKPLNIRSGKDLLYSVGRLSMMLNPSDYLPEKEVRPLPLNWTSPEFLSQRPGVDVKTIMLNLGRARPQLLFPEQQEQQLAFNSKYGDALMPNLDFLPRIASYLDPRSLMNLALTNRAMFAALTYGMPPTMLPGLGQQMMMANLAASGPGLFGKGRTKVQTDPGSFFTPMMGITSSKKWKNRVSNQVIPRVGKEIALGGDEYGMTLPWGDKQGVPLVNKGSVRLTFTEGGRIMKDIGDDSEAVDLSYERIVSYLNKLGGKKSGTELRQTFGDLSGTSEPFFGELAILLSGIEASQNNMSLLQAPMVADLVSDGVIGWEDALFRRRAVPYFVMAADKSEKGKYPMLRHSNALKSGKVTDDERGDYDKFESFIGQEFNLNQLFLETYFPQLKSLDLHDQLLLSSLIMKRYLKNVYQL